MISPSLPKSPVLIFRSMHPLRNQYHDEPRQSIRATASPDSDRRSGEMKAIEAVITTMTSKSPSTNPFKRKRDILSTSMLSLKRVGSPLAASTVTIPNNNSKKELETSSLTRKAIFTGNRNRPTVAVENTVQLKEGLPAQSGKATRIVPMVYQHTVEQSQGSSSQQHQQAHEPQNKRLKFFQNKKSINEADVHDSSPPVVENVNFMAPNLPTGQSSSSTVVAVARDGRSPFAARGPSAHHQSPATQSPPSRTASPTHAAEHLSPLLEKLSSSQEFSSLSGRDSESLAGIMKHVVEWVSHKLSSLDETALTSG